MTSVSARRRYRIIFRVTADERRGLAAKADQCGLTLSDFVRAAVLATEPHTKRRRPRVEAVLLARLLAKLGAINFHLGEIAAATRDATVALDLLPSIQRDIAQNLRCLTSCRAALLKALGKRSS